MQLDIKVRLVLNTFKARVRSGYFEVAQETEFKLAVQNSPAMQFNATLTQLPFTFYLIGFIDSNYYYYDTTKKIQKHTFIWCS